MIPELEKRLNDELEKASVKELIPDFDNEAAWAQLAHRIPPEKNRLALPVWSYAAAILVLASAMLLIWQHPGSHTQAVATTAATPVAPQDAATASVPGTATPGDATPYPTAPENKNEATVKKSINSRKDATNGAIYNGTPCPIELRISQTMNCPNNSPKAILNSSTVEPERSAQLKYKDNNTLGKDCSLTLEEIEIKSIATGEVILLTSNSTPSTAQEVFGYLTREKEGKVLAGVFDHDCNKKNRKQHLRLGNSAGNLVLE